MTEAPDTIRRLVQTFADNIESYRSASFNEAQVRREFIDPMFEALGWDVLNKQGHHPAYREVIHEDAIKVGGATKAPDYCFRIGQTPKFFLEAKRPLVNIKGDPNPAYQLRRYAWSAKLPLSILTDFEELAVYDCRAKPNQNDKASAGRTLYMSFTDYPDRWHEIADVFSREAILKGSFDKYAESGRRKRGTAEVDASFLAEIESWRDALAKNIALRNRSLSVREMNQAVQRTVDRILFLRMCEDRGIEQYGRLQALLNVNNVYGQLAELFNQADDKYNSGLFHFKSERGREDYDAWTLKLAIDDKVLKEIIKRLYYPECPYEFSVLPADILGHIYEQFLGKVIRLTPAHQAKVEEKPEVRKAGGVYYTPTYIVDYIVNNTVGKLCEGATPNKVAELRVLDPACGSGSFLLGAYQFLLDWHLKYYIDHDPAKWARRKKPPIYEGRNGWTLTTAMRKEILLNNIYGVDIDQQAVEVTKLSLLLKVLEGETEETLRNQMQLFRERALPDLNANIKCGNSLIGPDFYDGKQTTMFDDEEAYRINAFDWNAEFPDIMKRGGFDAVIGNPPYVFGRDWKGLGISDYHKAYFSRAYDTASYQMDMFSLFMEKAHRLCRLSGHIGLIVPNVWLNNTFCSKIRSLVIGSAQNLAIASPKSRVFPRLTVDTVVYTLRLDDRPSPSFTVLTIDDSGTEDILSNNKTSLFLDGERPISTVVEAPVLEFLEELLNDHSCLDDFAAITRGVHPYRTGGYGASAFRKGPQTDRDVKERVYHSAAPGPDLRPYVYGRDLHRYSPCLVSDYVRYGKWLAEPRKPEFFTGDRVYSRKILGERLIVTVVSGDSVAGQQICITKPKVPGFDVRYFAGIMSSRMMAFFIKSYFNERDDAFPQIKVSQLRSLPIRRIDFSRSDDKTRHDRMVELVERMLDLHKRLDEVRTEHEKAVLRRQIKATDDEIDRLVYELYDLTEEEIAIVE
ncbi:MAG: N-6 DNA methylase, partial [Candidatus Coatesbacteria bacterium]|nr:N-6 DNA methylase [Candidatus Coatesbacteria bacterium]